MNNRAPVRSGFEGPLLVKNVTKPHFEANPNPAYAVKLIHSICCLAGSPSYIDDIREDLGERGVIRAIKDHDTPVLFDWLMEVLSFQGISDGVALGYIADHGNARWSEIAAALAPTAPCPKLGGYWRFYDCRYHKGSETCSEPGHINGCPCLAIRCGTAASTRWRTACFCSCAISPMGISSNGSTGN